MKVVVIGLGIGKFAVEAALTTPDVELAMVCDADPRKYKVAQEVYQKLGLEVPPQDLFLTTNPDRVMERSDIDAVVIALPNFLHEPVAVAAFKAGKHVLLEKPMARNLEEAAAIHQAWKTAGTVGMMVMNNCMRRHYRMILEMLQHGELGEIQRVEGWWLRGQGRPFRGKWFTDIELSSGGPIVDLSVHPIGMLLGTLGWVQPVYVTGFSRQDFTYPKRGEGCYGGGTDTPDAPVTTEDSAEAVFTFHRDGRTVPADVKVSWVANIAQEKMGIHVYGTNASVKMERVWPRNNDNDAEATDTLIKVGHRLLDGDWVTYTETLDCDQAPRFSDVLMGRVPMARHFYQVVLGQAQPFATLDQALITQRMLHAWQLSAVTGGVQVALQ